VVEDAGLDSLGRKSTRLAIEKALDIALDVISSSQQTEEMSRVFVNPKLEGIFIRFADRFTYGLNLALVLALMGVSMIIAWTFCADAYNLVAGGTAGALEKGVLSAIGMLMILWMMIELIENEIKNLRGGSFNILVFISVIMVATIREVLLTNLRHDDLRTQAFLVVTLLVLGVVYSLVSRSMRAK
jgi:phosphate starvation-inducible membrane PsiE